jgi:hypothetical protein
MCRSSLRNHWRKIKERKHVTSRIATRGDIENVLSAIEDTHQNEQIDDCHYQNYGALLCPMRSRSLFQTAAAGV